MKSKHFFIVILLAFGLFITGLSKTPGQAAKGPASHLKEADRCRKTLHYSAKKKRYRHHWFRCLDRYRVIYTRYAKSDQAAWALYHSARLFTSLYAYSKTAKDLDQAIRLYRRLIGEYRDHRLADDAQYGIGEIIYVYKKDLPRAYEAFLSVETRFPSGDMRPKADKMLHELAVRLKKRGDAGKIAGRPEILLNEADRRRAALAKSAKKRRYRHHWFRCLDKYKEIYTRYPESDQAAWALYHSAGLFTSLYAYSKTAKDLDEAIRLYRKVTQEYQDHSLADDAQYKIGEIYYQYKKDKSQAYVELLKVEVQYPLGDMRGRAKEMLDALAAALGEKGADSDAKREGIESSGLVGVKDIRHWSTPNYTRVVVDLEGPVKYAHHLIKADPRYKKPRRLYFDLKNATVTSKIDRPRVIKDGLLQRARAGQHTQDTVRVVLDIESIGGYEVFHLYDPFRIVVDVSRVQKKGDKKEAGQRARKQTAPAERILKKTAPKKTALKKPVVRKGIRKAGQLEKKESLAKQLGLSVKRIVLDAGHGAHDPGCHHKKNIKEKNIVLSLARVLAGKIKKEIGCEVFLTRKKDVFLSLEQRTAIANMKKADLFISLHVNAHKDRSISGLETYYLNMATDENAVMVAARENATSQKRLSDLQMILNSLMMNTKIHESSRLAHEIQKGMVSGLRKNYKGVKSLGVKQAPFYVLIGAQMPAVLIETGFLTNTTERKRLVSKRYRERLAKGICAGIKAYMKSIDDVYMGG
jgi:N-acetylmuramoyl-L-alanine amidase